MSTNATVPTGSAAPNTGEIPTAAPDLAAIKERQQLTWASGDYAVVGTTLPVIAEDALRGGRPPRRAARPRRCHRQRQRGALPPPAASADVIGDRLRPGPARAGSGQRAEAERPAGRRSAEGDAEDVPFPDASFDVVLSTLGVMFAPDQEKAAQRTAARLPARRQTRPGELDTRRIHRADVPDDRPRSFHRRPASSRRRSGAPRSGSGNSSATTSPPLPWRGAASSSATARSTTCWRSSGRTTARC